jgi:hypothetical protein
VWNVSGMVSFLEAENPTARAAESMSLLGRWELAFCGVNRGLKVPETQGLGKSLFILFGNLLPLE